MSAVRLSFLQVTNSEVITAHSNAWHTRIAMSLHTHTLTHTRLHRDTHDSIWQTDGRPVLRTHTCWLSMSKHTECSHRHLQHSVCTFTHVTQTHTCICPHTHCLEDVRTPFLLSSQSHWRRHAYTHTHSIKTWWKVTRHVRTSYDSQPHLISFYLLSWSFSLS